MTLPVNSYSFTQVCLYDDDSPVVKIGPAVPEIYAPGQTDTQTDKPTATLHFPTGAE